MEPFYNHFKFRHQVDDHNAKRHKPISLEETWSTKWYAHRVFAFLLAVTEVNVKLMMDYLQDKKDENPTAMIDFRKKLVKELIENPYLVGEEEGVSPRNLHVRQQAIHHLMEKPPQFTAKFDGRAWKRSCVQYLQQCCKYRRKMRTYCACDKTIFYCVPCFANHFNEV
jgi:hypothetical protein